MMTVCRPWTFPSSRAKARERSSCRSSGTRWELHPTTTTWPDSGMERASAPERRESMRTRICADTAPVSSE